MARPTRSIRGVQDIRTISGKPDIVNEPYRAYMRITALEMEKARKTKEKESALDRVRTIESRVKEIEAEKASLLAILMDQTAEPIAPGSGQDSAVPYNNGFTFKY